MNLLKTLLANSSSVNKFIVAVAGVVLTGLTTHNWTGTANVISDGVALLVYLIPNVGNGNTTKSAG